MNQDFAIKVKNISKKFKNDYVLENVSFNITKGESVGIIGRNGAGKSTLLKIIAGIIKPSSGMVEIEGKVTSILEFGSGFLNDLSGRENIIMLAKLLGFRKRDISEKVNEIIEFSDLQKYIDDPIKTYSSGMYLRLAFSIYSVLNSDILIIDEVLSVGDAAFKKKALNVIQDFKNKGKTLVLVSHNFNEINNYCDRIIYIDKYLKIDSKSVMAVINQYLIESFPKRNLQFQKIGQTSNYFNAQNELIELLDINYKTAGKSKTIFENSDPIDLCIIYRKKTSIKSIQISVLIFDFNDTLLFQDSPAFKREYTMQPEPEGVYQLIMKIPSNFLNEGEYFVTLGIAEECFHQDTWHNVSSFKVELDKWLKNKMWGLVKSSVFADFKWETSRIQ